MILTVKQILCQAMNPAQKSQSDTESFAGSKNKCKKRDINDEKGLEKMAISYQGSALGLRMLKSSITGEEFENRWWLE